MKIGIAADHWGYKLKENLKQDLAKKYADERPKYTAGKNEFIKDVIMKAKEEYHD